MPKLLVVGAALLSVALSTVAAARGNANEFAVGSAKTEMEASVGDEHASFSAHSVAGTSCEAKGQIVYRSDFAAFTTKIDSLTIIGNGAFFAGEVTKVVSGPVEVGDAALFHAADSGMPGGTGDTFAFEGWIPGGVEGQPLCVAPAAGHLITRGNIVIKTTLP
jgi:hypothetical protein